MSPESLAQTRLAARLALLDALRVHALVLGRRRHASAYAATETAAKSRT